MLGLALEFFGDAHLEIDRLASIQPNQATLEIFFQSPYPYPLQGVDNGRAKKTHDDLVRLFEHGIGHDLSRVVRPHTRIVPERQRSSTANRFVVFAAIGHNETTSVPTVVGQRKGMSRGGLDAMIAQVVGGSSTRPAQTA